MDESIMQLTCGGILAVLLVREVMNFLKTRNGKSNGTATELVRSIEILRMESRENHDWHKPNPDGKQTWKNAEMIEAVRDMKKVVENNTQVVVRLIGVLDRIEARA